MANRSAMRSGVRPFSLVHTEDQWRRTAHEDTSLHLETGSVQLAWDLEPPAEVPAGATPGPAGLAFDPYCRLYHVIPEAGQVERLFWRQPGALDPVRPDASPVPILAFDNRSLDAHGGTSRGQFSVSTGHTEGAGPLRTPTGVAVDDDGRLFVGESDTGLIYIYDLWERRLLRKVFAGGSGPIDLACNHGRMLVVGPGVPGLVILDARTGPEIKPWPEALLGPVHRIATAPPHRAYLLIDAGQPTATVVSLTLPVAGPGDAFAVPHATDLALVVPEPESGADVLVVARAPGQDFLRYRISPNARDLMPTLKAKGYDGRGIVCTPDGRIGFFTARGFRHAVAARVRYARRGRVTTFRLDSGAFQTRWGRIFIDACIPRSTAVAVHAVVADEPPAGPILPRTPPANTAAMQIHRPDLSPPMPPLSLVPASGEVTGRLHCRSTGREFPWTRNSTEDDRNARFATYEAPVIAVRGRYLWLTVELSGDTRSTPRIASIRVERPGHDLLRRLPGVFSRDREAGDFLYRYLALLDGMLADLDARAFARHALIDPRSAPPEFLPWLAEFVGLVVDERWPAAAQRIAIREAMWLFRFRGTVPGLMRFLEIYLGRPAILIEHFRVRGLGGAVVGTDSALPSRAILGAGFRVGGAIGTGDEGAVLGGGERVADGFETHAHRFTVIVPAVLSREELDVVRHILDVHRPCHTIFDVCTVDAGMRVGVGMYAGLTSIVGHTAGFREIRVGDSTLGRDGVLGRPRGGTRIGTARLGRDARVE